MAEHLVLEGWRGVGPATGIGAGQTFEFEPGDVIDDTLVPVTALKADGLATIPNIAALSTATTAFKEAHGAQQRSDRNVMAVLEAYGVTPSQTTLQGNALYVDAAYTGGGSNGSFLKPYTTISAALTAASSGMTVFVRQGSYTEDLTLVTGVDILGESGPRGRGPEVTGTATATDVSCVIEQMSFVDDGAGNAVHFTGTTAAQLEMNRCLLTGTATGGAPLEIDNTLVTASVIMNDSQIIMTTGNAVEVVRVESGIFNAYDCVITHEDDTSESVVHEGDAAGAVNLFNCQLTGQVGSEAAAANPTMWLVDSHVTVGAVAAVTVAALNTVSMHGCRITSTEGANNALTGAGTYTMSAGPHFLSTADQIAPAATTVFLADARTQSGRYTEAAGAGARAIAFARDMPSTNYTVVFGVEDTGAGTTTATVATGTKAVSGFTLDTGGNAIIHWMARMDD
jgi:hypothetical protein